MGDTIFAYCLVLFLLFFLNKKELPKKLLTAVFITSVLVQIIKNIFTPLSVHLYFENGAYFNHGGNEPYRNIISSHTAIIFTLAGLFITTMKNKPAKAVIFFLRSLLLIQGFILQEMICLLSYLVLYLRSRQFFSYSDLVL